MTVVLDLPSELEAELSTEATRLGITLQEYVLRVIAVGRVLRPAPQTGAQLVEYWRTEGLLGTRPEIDDSQAHSRKIRAEAEMRVRY